MFNGFSTLSKSCTILFYPFHRSILLLLLLGNSLLWNTKNKKSNKTEYVEITWNSHTHTYEESEIKFLISRCTWFNGPDFMHYGVFLSIIWEYSSLHLSNSYGIVFKILMFFFLSCTWMRYDVCVRSDFVVISIEPRWTTVLCAKFIPPHAYIEIVVIYFNMYKTTSEKKGNRSAELSTINTARAFYCV